MSDIQEQDHAGALPSLDQKQEVLGTPEARIKSKTNVGKFAVLGIVLVAFLFVIVGLLFWQKAKQRAAENQPAAVAGAKEKPAFAVKNASLGEASSIEQTKAEIRRKADDDARALKALEEAQREAANAAPKGAATAGNASAAGTASAGQQGAGAQAPKPKPQSGVLLELSGARPVPPKDGEGNGPAPASVQAPASSSTASRDEEYKRRMAALGITPGSSGGTTQGGSFAAMGGDSFGAKMQPTVLQGRKAGRLPNLDYLLKKGTSIPCALKTGIDTTLPGFVICMVVNDVYSANNKTLLIERGATVFGEQTTGLKQGQARTFVLWSRIDNPNGVFADIDSPASDQMGYAGIPGYVDTHFWQRFGGAIMLSMIRDFSTAYSQKATGTTGQTQNYGYTQQATQDMASEALRNSINIPPTLTVLPGTVVNVLVARDVSFENLYNIVD